MTKLICMRASQPPGPASKLILIFLLLIFFIRAGAQTSVSHSRNNIIRFPQSKPNIPYLREEGDFHLFATGTRYIENIGQYGDTLTGHARLGKILYGFEGLDMPVLFTPKGMICLQRKMNKFTAEQMEEMERSGTLNKELKEGTYYTDRVITAEWLNANPDPQVIAEQAAANYYTYALLPGKARGLKKIIYKELYPGIDIVYSFINKNQPGFEYAIVIKPGADASVVKMRFGGDIKELQTDAKGNLIFGSDINSFIQTSPVSYYCNTRECDAANAKNERIDSRFHIKGNELSFELPASYDRSKTVMIDPFVTAATNLVGVNSGVAKDIDFDYQGNIYVSGGGSSFTHQLAKFSPNGVLQWTFNGTLTTPSWNFGNNYGGWVIEKTTGNIYLGQGGSATFRVVRLNTNGVYDGYISVQDPAFQENWKMIWNCDGGTPKILIAGGGSANQNINLGICTPPSTVLTPLNITGQPTGHQDIADLVIDPKTNELYSIFAQNFITPITENNRMYKHTPSYSAGNISWKRLSGFTVLSERSNRPYLADAAFNDNSINGLAVNSDYLFYYDGRNLAAMNKSNGNNIGTAEMLTLNTALMQGGIIADECNNVYIGTTNGTIKVYKFNGTAFDDAGAADITIAGFPAGAVYDLAYDNGRKLLYACGRGFVASIDISSYCASAIYIVAVNRDCISLSAKATISPALPQGSTVTYVLYNGSTQLSSNTNGSFAGLSANVNYTVKALVDQACGGTQAIKDFNMNNCGAAPNGSGIYVPAAFTPNGDGLNDILKAIPFGIKEFRHFALYNRWGELVFRTTDPSVGWDGTFRGKKQDAAVFVWIAEAVDFDDKSIKIKGTVILIR